jgi:hypothetical protein
VLITFVLDVLSNALANEGVVVIASPTVLRVLTVGGSVLLVNWLISVGVVVLLKAASRDVEEK